ncbi:MAG: DUF2059 domain-containing protein [Acidobacteriota bacterium]
MKNRTVPGRLVLAAVSILVAACAMSAEETRPARRSKEEAIRELMAITGASNMGRQVMEQMRPALLQAVPGIPDSFWDEFMADVRMDELTDLVVPIYAKYFTSDELEQLIAFNKTPLGRKVIATMPSLMKESMAAGQAWGRALGERAYRKAQERAPKPEPGH